MTRAPTREGLALADAAAALIGISFRLHGREPATGLDCLGVLAAALAAIGRPAVLPVAYSLRSRVGENVDAIAHNCGLVATVEPTVAGDVAFVRIGATQSHVLIAAGDRRFVHAHAGLRRVVEHAGALAWPLAALWRLDDSIGD